MKKNPKLLFLFFSPFLASCLGNSVEEDYSQWRTENLTFIESAEAETINGQPKYEKIIPNWDTSIFTLMQWHNDRTLTQGNLSPLSNSTIDVKYILTNINGDTLDTSKSLTDYGEGIFRCRPSNMVTGFWNAVTSMHVGDSATAIIPYNAAYGTVSYGNILPYSTLIFNIKLDSIVAYESLPWRQ